MQTDPLRWGLILVQFDGENRRRPPEQEPHVDMKERRELARSDAISTAYASYVLKCWSRPRAPAMAPGRELTLASRGEPQHPISRGTL